MSTVIEPKATSDRAVEVAWTPRMAVPSGIAVAALMSVVIGVVTLAVVNIFTTASPAFNAWVHSIGKLWMPGAQGIGPYSGKETLSAIAWLASWLILHYALRRREMNLSRWVIGFLVGVGLATTLIWPPVFEFIAHGGKG
jgi:hypothetical protein